MLLAACNIRLLYIVDTIAHVTFSFCCSRKQKEEENEERKKTGTAAFRRGGAMDVSFASRFVSNDQFDVIASN